MKWRLQSLWCEFKINIDILYRNIDAAAANLSPCKIFWKSTFRGPSYSPVWGLRSKATETILNRDNQQNNERKVPYQLCSQLGVREPGFETSYFSCALWPPDLWNFRLYRSYCCKHLVSTCQPFRCCPGLSSRLPLRRNGH